MGADGYYNGSWYDNGFYGPHKAEITINTGMATITDNTRGMSQRDAIAYEIFSRSIDIKDTASAAKCAKNAFQFADAFLEEREDQKVQRAE